MDNKFYQSIRDICDMYINNKCLPKEDDSGNIEYKSNLVRTTPEKRNKMKTQLIYRINEGYLF